MMCDSELDLLQNLLESSFVPELKVDLDNIPINRDHFAEYLQLIKIQLPLIFDLVQKQCQPIHEEVQSMLILLLCEVTADAVYRLDNEELMNNARRLLAQEELNEKVENLIFQYYTSKLKKDNWKRQLGAIHGFQRYLEDFCNETSRQTKLFNTRWMTFCLAISLNVRDCHENEYKNLGIKIMLTILKNAPTNVLKDANIPSVIYDNVYKDVHFMESVKATEAIWTCLYTCLDFFPDIDSLNWSQVDDMMEVLTRNIPLASNTEVSICMLNFVTKLCAYFTLNHIEMLQVCDLNLKDSLNINCFRELCSSNSSFTSFRWAKSILDLFVVDSYKLMTNSDICMNLLMEMHKCYMIAILPIPLQVNEDILCNFYEKFIAVLMEVITVQRSRNDIIKIVLRLIETFIWQLKRSDYCEESVRLKSFHKALEKLRECEIFL